MVDEAGYKYVENKLISAIKDEEEKAVTRMNAEKMHVAEQSAEQSAEAQETSRVQFSFVGKSEDGRNIYKTNYPSRRLIA